MAISRSTFRAAASLAIGGAVFLVATGGAVLDPFRTGWLLHGDPAQHYIGWLFYRTAPLFQLPLGANPAFGETIGSSIVFTDSLPLLAIPLRLLTRGVRGDIQFTGLWILLCLVLQAWFAQSLLGRFTRDRWLLALGAGFFVLLPPLLWRLHGHYALLGQWVIVAALDLYGRAPFRTPRWMALLAVSTLVHPYLLVMVIGVLLAENARRVFVSGAAVSLVGRQLVGLTTLVVASMWAAGYFMVPGGGRGGGFGVFRTNLLAFLDPDPEWSRILPDLPGGPGQYEGFAFLGVGILALVPVAGIAWIRRGAPFELRNVAPVIVVAAAALAFALSNRVAVGGRELFEIDVPERLAAVTSLFRASGRMSWIAVHLVAIGVLAFVVRGFRPGIARWLCGAALALQLWDELPVLEAFRERARAPAEVARLEGSAWDRAGHHHDRLLYVQPHNDSPGWAPLALFAVHHGMSIDTGYFARVDPCREERARAEALRAVVDPSSAPGALLVFAARDPLAAYAVARAEGARALVAADGFDLVGAGLAPAPISDPPVIPRVGRRWESVGRRGAAGAGLAFGWHPPYRRAWTSGDRAGLVIRPEAGARRLELDLRALPRSTGNARRIEVRVDGRSASTVTLPAPGGAFSAVVSLPPRRGAIPVLVEILAADSSCRARRDLDLGLRAVRVDGISAVVAPENGPAAAPGKLTERAE